jgi:hypothetical protein
MESIPSGLIGIIFLTVNYFGGRYKAILVEADSYLLELLRYIHRNPLEAGLVSVMDKYPWGSHQGYLSDAKKWRWLYKDFILSLFSDEKAVSRKMYKGFVSKGTREEINQIFGRKNLPSALGIGKKRLSGLGEEFVFFRKASRCLIREKLFLVRQGEKG